MRKASRSTVVAATLATATVLVLPLSSTAVAGPTRSRSDHLQKSVTLHGVMRHLKALQHIADANDGTRAAGLPGYADSVTYVVKQMRRAGYEVDRQPFRFEFYRETADPSLARTAPAPEKTYAEGTDFSTMTFSGTGDVTAAVQGVDLALGAPETSTSGCEPADFQGFTKGNIALVQRGTCAFADKATNAAAAGAAAVIVFNQGNGADRSGLLEGTLGGHVVDIPVVGTTFALGQELSQQGTQAHVSTETFMEPRTTWNVTAQTRRGNPDNVVMLGAHLDSVPEGPGIDDNGTGSATLLEVAQQMAKVHPKNQVRFAWWGAEELGLVGSTEYVDSLTAAQRDRIALYLNFDMLGSPNFIRGVYDGDGSDFGTAGPAGSDAIEHQFNRHFAGEGLPFQATAFDGRSDYQAFIDNDIPAGGLFTGADETKTAEEEAIYGGVAGAILDPCYHQACDSRTPVADGGDRDVYSELYEENHLKGNIAPEALDTNADAIADAAITYAFDTSGLGGAAPQPAKSARTSAAHTAHPQGVAIR